MDDNLGRLFDYLEKTLSNKPHKGQEYFIGPMISEISSDGYQVLPTTVFCNPLVFTPKTPKPMATL